MYKFTIKPDNDKELIFRSWDKLAYEFSGNRFMLQIFPLCSIVEANIESLDQGLNLLNSISSDAYQKGSPPITNSSIGEHFRHILDMYFALINGLQSSFVDLNHRRRGANVETDVNIAITEIQQIRHWLISQDLKNDQSFRLKTEVTVCQTQSAEIQTHLSRELIFTSSHAVHHYAIINIIAKLQGLEVDDNGFLVRFAINQVKSWQIATNYARRQKTKD